MFYQWLQLAGTQQTFQCWMTVSWQSSHGWKIAPKWKLTSTSVTLAHFKVLLKQHLDDLVRILKFTSQYCFPPKIKWNLFHSSKSWWLKTKEGKKNTFIDTLNSRFVTHQLIDFSLRALKEFMMMTVKRIMRVC